MSNVVVAERSAADDRLRVAFQLATSWATALPELCYLDGPASKAFQAAIAFVGAERDERIYRSRIITADDYAAAHVILGAADHLWNRRDARRRIRAPKSISNFEILDCLFVEHRSMRYVAERFDLALRTVQDRYSGALKELGDAYDHLCDRCDILSPSAARYHKDRWLVSRRRLAAFSNALTVPASTAHLDDTISGGATARRREWHYGTKAYRSRPLPQINVWHGLYKSDIRKAADVLVEAYLTNGGKITQCRPAKNYLSESYWMLPRSRKRHERDVESFLGSGHNGAELRYITPKPSPDGEPMAATNAQLENRRPMDSDEFALAA